MQKKILIIDDDEMLAQEVRLTLEETGAYEVFIETLGAHGFSSALEFKPDLILLDLHIPEVPGTEIAAQLLQHPLTKRIPIVYFTGLATPDEVKEHQGLVGGQPFIAKPCQIEEVIQTIQENLPEKRQAA